MSELLDTQVAELQRRIAELQNGLDERTAERNEAEAEKAAISEILAVINASQADPASVFDAILEKAHELCGAVTGSLQLYEGEFLRAVATRGLPEAFAKILREPRRSSHSREAFLKGKPYVQVTDAADPVLTQGNPTLAAGHKIAGIRSVLNVPLRKGEDVLGVIVGGRMEVRPFSDKQIALLQSFAAQAVIAMENARLLNETRQRTGELQEALEYQTATSDVLKLISRSDADLETVLENLVETMTRLCQADYGHLFRRRDSFHHLIASFGLTAEYRDYLKAHPFAPDRGTLSGRVALEGRIVQIEDAASDPEYARSDFQQRGNLRTGLGVPLLREDTLLGIIALYRSRVECFTDKQIALAATFADQAVIAIENARLLGEHGGWRRNVRSDAASRRLEPELPGTARSAG